jgi:hypothetical protein
MRGKPVILTGWPGSAYLVGEGPEQAALRVGFKNAERLQSSSRDQMNGSALAA